MKPAPKTIEDLIGLDGRQTFEKEIGVKTQLVTRALAEEVMPPRWYLAVRKFCEARGVGVPDHLFKMHGVVHSVKQNANASEGFQGEGAK